MEGFQHLSPGNGLVYEVFGLVYEVFGWLYIFHLQ